MLKQIEFNPDWIDDNGFMTGALQDKEILAHMQAKDRLVGYQIFSHPATGGSSDERIDYLSNLYLRCKQPIGSGNYYPLAFDFRPCHGDEYEIQQDFARYRSDRQRHPVNARAYIYPYHISVVGVDMHWAPVDAAFSQLDMWRPYSFDGKIHWLTDYAYPNMRQADHVPAYLERWFHLYLNHVDHYRKLVRTLQWLPSIPQVVDFQPSRMQMTDNDTSMRLAMRSTPINFFEALLHYFLNGFIKSIESTTVEETAYLHVAEVIYKYMAFDSMDEAMAYLQHKYQSCLKKSRIVSNFPGSDEGEVNVLLSQREAMTGRILEAIHKELEKCRAFWKESNPDAVANYMQRFRNGYFK